MRILSLLLLTGVAWADNSARTDMAAPTACPTAQFEATLTKAGKNVSSVKSGAVSFDQLASGMDDACRVQLWKSYWHFYLSVQQAYTKKMDEGRAAQNKLAREIKSLGWSYVESEGGSYVTDGGDWLARRIGGRLPLPWREYLGLRLLEDAEVFEEDGGLQISWTKLRERVRRWEDFLVAHPGFELNDQIGGLRKMYLGILLGGMDNSPTFDESGVLKDDVRRELEAYIADGKARDRKLVKTYYEMLKANRYHDSDDIQHYLSVRKLRPAEMCEAPRF
jgi:hypothetical protein